MKTAIDFIKEANEGYSFRDVVDNLTDGQLLCAIEDYARYYANNQTIISNGPVRVLAPAKDGMKEAG